MQRIQVAAGIIWSLGRFLAAKRPPGKPREGLWEFPGGKREPGESMKEALCRELLEELDIDCRTVLPWRTLLHEYPDICVELHFMHVTHYLGSPSPKDGQELRWVTPAEALALPFLPADKAILEALNAPGFHPV